MTGRTVPSRHHPQATLTHKTASVTESSTEVVAQDKYRSYLLLINDSPETIYIKFGATAAKNEGIRLDANGGSYECHAGKGNLDTQAVNAIALSGSPARTLLITKAR